MKLLKLLLVALALSYSSIIHAEKPGRIIDLNSLAAEVETLVRESRNIIQEWESLTLFFSVSEDKSKQFVNVA